jgi:hypothetical protein
VGLSIVVTSVTSSGKRSRCPPAGAPVVFAACAVPTAMMLWRRGTAVRRIAGRRKP